MYDKNYRDRIREFFTQWSQDVDPEKYMAYIWKENYMFVFGEDIGLLVLPDDNGVFRFSDFQWNKCWSEDGNGKNEFYFPIRNEIYPTNTLRSFEKCLSVARQALCNFATYDRTTGNWKLPFKNGKGVWYFVDCNGTEWLSEQRPRRKEKECVWVTWFGQKIRLVEGTITKVLGYPLTWNDEPVKVFQEK